MSGDVKYIGMDAAGDTEIDAKLAAAVVTVWVAVPRTVPDWAVTVTVPAEPVDRPCCAVTPGVLQVSGRNRNDSGAWRSSPLAPAGLSSSDRHGHSLPGKFRPQPECRWASRLR
jgi:hypothetical protein